MENLLSKIRFMRQRRDGRAAIRFACRFLCLLLLAGFLVGAAAAVNVPGNSAAANRSGLQFAIADFDGDSRPDLARVEAGASDFTNTEYWIQLRLSAAGWESIRLVAPAGGLQLAARDVNGDESVDLVVSSAWSNRPVAIYLNDGHGSFTHAEPGAFPGAFSDAATIWACRGNLGTDKVVVLSERGAGVCAAARDLLGERCSPGSIPLSRAGFPNSGLLLLRAGRAPPFEVFHF